MFQSSKSTLSSSSKICSISNSKIELKIIHRFDFSSKLQRMSVICKDKNEYYKIFTKGSPEKIIKFCNKKTIPENFERILNNFARKGFRIIAFAYKFMNFNESEIDNLILEEIEKNFIFLGLMIIENKLKKNTKKTIEILNQAQMKMIIATGDNNLTAISVANEINLINNENLFSVEIENENLFIKKINFSKNSNENNLNSNENLLNNSILNSNDFDFNQNDENSISFTQRNKKTSQIHIHSNIFSLKLNSNIILSISGENFEKLSKIKTKSTIFSKTFKIILNHCLIFSRMNPDQKKLLIENLREEKFNVLMCGDGANDCSALRSADVGVSLSAEEASIAAHFTSKIKDISCLIDLIKEGKCSLVTSIQTFKYIIIYSLIQFFNVMFLCVLNSYFSDFQWLISDIFVIFPLEFLIARTKSYEKLTKNVPEFSLISFPILLSVILNIIIILFFQVFSIFLLKKKKWYLNICEVDEEKVFACYENNVLFLVGMIQYFIAAICFCVGEPYRKKMFSNRGLMFYLCFSLFLCGYMILFPAGWMKKIVPISDFEDGKFNVVLVMVGIANFCVEFVIERFFVTYVERVYNKFKLNKMKEEIELNEDKIFPVVNYYLIKNYEKNNNN